MGANPTAIVLEMEFAGVGNGWTNVWSAVRGQVPVVCTYGIQSGGSAGDRVAQPGSLTFALDNSTPNLGYYSPGHANARSGFDVGIGVRFSITSDASGSSVTYTKFNGRIGAITVTPNQRGPWTTLVTCYDYFDELLRTSLKRVPVQVSKRGDEIFDLIVDEMPTDPGSSTSGTGRETYALALDAKSPEEGLSTLGEMQKLAMSEAGYIFCRGTTSTSTAMQLVYESRTDRAKNNTAQTTFTDAHLADISISRSRETILNRILVKTHPRRKDASAVTLFVMRDATVSDTSALSLSPGGSQTLTCPYTDPDDRSRRCAGTSMVTPAQTTHYQAFANADGSGTDLTASLGVAATFGGTSASVVLTNNHASSSLYVTKLNLSGIGIYDDQNAINIHEQEDSASQTAYGTRAYTYDATYQMDPSKGDSFARHFLGVYKDAQQTAESITFNANTSTALLLAALAREPSDRIDVSEVMSAVNEGYFIQSVSLMVTPKSMIKCTWTLTPASRIRYWFIGTVGASEIGTNTVIGF